MPTPFGIAKTDAFLMKLSELFGKPVPESLKAERGRAVDAMTDAHQYIHGKKFAVYGDPDYLLGYVSFLLEMGAKAVPHPLQQGDQRSWRRRCRRCSTPPRTARRGKST